VKETIMTSALLRLPLSIPKKEKVHRVMNIIEQLVRSPLWQTRWMFEGERMDSYLISMEKLLCRE
jgi:hypothetical protein